MNQIAFIAFTILFSLSFTTFSQSTAIPDPIFEQALIDLGYDVGPTDGFVPTANIQFVTDLNVSGLGITDLTGIMDFTSLISLDCSNNSISSLSFAPWDAYMPLQNLNCSYNLLTSLDYIALTNLDMLNCSHNSLPYFMSPDPMTPTNLTYLDCSFNPLDSLDQIWWDITMMHPTVRTLICNNANLHTLNLEGCTQLETLWCNNNTIRQLNTSNCPNLIDFYAQNNMLISLDFSNNTGLSSMNASNNELECLNLTGTQLESFMQFVADPYSFNAQNNPDLAVIKVSLPSSIVLPQATDPASAFGAISICDFPTSFGGGGNIIKGTVYQNGPTVCSIGSPLSGIIVQTSEGNYDITNANGEYTLYANAGPVQVFQAPSGYYNDVLAQTCPVGVYNENFMSPPYSTVLGRDFYNDILQCANLQVSLSCFSRRCFENNMTINYANLGNSDTTNVHVLLDILEGNSISTSSVPYTITPEGFYDFAIGDLAAGESGMISITYMLDCSWWLGEYYCPRAWITPENTCSYENSIDLVDWDQSAIEVAGACIDDTLIGFTIYNTGTGDMTRPSEYRIYHNGQLMNVGEVEMISGDSTEIFFTANAGAYWIEVDQVRDYPTYSNPNVYVHSCVEGETALIYENSSLNDDEETDYATGCSEVIGAYDPNDKQHFPPSIGEFNYIAPDTEMEYLIRFQNTGTDTAFNIVITDTISPLLDLSTFQLLGYSHPIEIDIIGDDVPVMLFSFYDILLPDSTTNLLGSQGFVRFKLSPIADLPLGTEIHNAADIYFDFNEPVRTNDSWYTIYDTIPGDIALIVDPVAPNMQCNAATAYLDETGYAEVLLDDLIVGSTNYLLSSVESNLVSTTMDCSNLGMNDYTISASNEYGQMGSCSNQIQVLDIIAPVPFAENLDPVLSECDVIGLDLPIVTDNCGGILTIAHDAILPITTIGTTIITWTYSDASGNTSSQVQEVTITPIDNATFTILETSAELEISAVATGYNYQWFYGCEMSAPIEYPGATGQALTATEPGGYSVVISNGICSVESDCYFYWVESIDELLKNTIKVYPNPVHDELIIESESDELMEINLTTITGELVRKISMSQNQMTISLMDLAPGIYFLVVKDEKNTGESIRIIKQ